MSNPDPPSAGQRSYDYSIPTLGTKAPPPPGKINPLTPVSLLFAAIFVFLGLLLLPMTGFQADEVMFVYDLWHPEAALSAIGLHHHVLPSMMMPYLGAFKSWLYVPIFGAVGYSPYAVRLPMLLLAAATIFMAGRLLRRIQGTTAGIIAVALLATDVVFLVTSVFDWGPVVLQNFLLVAGLLFALRWYDTGRDRYAFLTGLAYGLALWNKALFIWNLSGIVGALLLLALPTVLRKWKWKAAALLAAGLCIGAIPLLKFNLQTRGATLQSSGQLALSAIGDKAWYFSFAINGGAAPTANVDLENQNPDRKPHSLSSAARSLAAKLGPTTSSWRFPVGVLVIALGLLVGGSIQRKWMLFFLISGVLGWLQSAITPDAGRSIHHTVLFWINWYAAVALGFGCLAKWHPPVSRTLAWAAAAILAIMGMVTTVVEYGDLLRHSTNTPWTDADAALAAKLSELGANEAVTTDWGIADVLALRSRNRIAVKQQEFNLNGGSFDRDEFQACKAPNCYLVTHVPERLLMAKASATLEDSLKKNGFVQRQEALIDDTHGTPTFLLLAASSGTSATPNITEPLPVPTISSVPQLLAAPAVILTTGATGRTTLTWRVPATMAVEIHVGAPDGALFASGIGPGQERTGFWVKNGTQFFLQDVTNGKPRTDENTVARITVGVRPQ